MTIPKTKKTLTIHIAQEDRDKLEAAVKSLRQRTGEKTSAGKVTRDQLLKWADEELKSQINPFAACLEESDDTYASGMRDGYAIGTELQTLDREPWHIMDQILDMNLVHKKNLQMLKAQAKKCKDSESELESFASPEEDEAWAEAEKRMEAIGQNGNDGDHYDAPPSKYHVLIKGQRVDVYDVLRAYGVTNPADAHAIKKMLCPGKRGVKDGIQDRTEAIVSLQRAIELEQGQ